METFGELTSMQEDGARAKATFHAQFLRTQAYEWLSPMRAYDGGRLERLEDACWRFRCAATRKELKGPGANRALSLLLRLKRELGEPCWLPEQVPTALDTLQDELQRLASKRPQGRPRDGIGQTFRRNMGLFFSHQVLLKSGYRVLLKSEIDDLLSELSEVATGRPLLFDSYVRMRKRERAAENRVVAALHRQRPPRLRGGRQLHRRTRT